MRSAIAVVIAFALVSGSCKEGQDSRSTPNKSEGATQSAGTPVDASTRADDEAAVASDRQESVPPKARLPAMPRRWHCIKSADVENMSTCFASAEQCDMGRTKLTDAGARYTGCMEQEAASCFTFYSNLLERTSFDCSATIAACERQRHYMLKQGASDVRSVYDCTSWRASVDEPAPEVASDAKRFGGDEIYCSDMAANGKVIHRFACQFLEEDCEAMAAVAERSGEASFRAQGAEVEVTMGTCKRSREPAFCTRLDNGYTCTALKEHCDAMAAEAIRSGKANTVGRCVQWRPGKFL